MVVWPIPRYDLPMPRIAGEILADARRLHPSDLDWLIENLLTEGDEASEKERFAVWQKQAGKPEPGYWGWFRAGVEEALADTSPDIPREVVAEEIANLLRTAREAPRLKATA